MLAVKFFGAFIVIAIFVLSVLGSLLYVVGLPLVHYSNSLQECEKVIVKGVEQSCDELPEKYTLIYTP